MSGRASIMQYLFNTTLNIDGIWGGYSGPGTKTILPHRAVAKLDSRLVPNQTPDEALRLIRAHQVVIAAAAPAELARRFGVPTGSPVLMFRRTYYQDTGRPAEFVLEYQNSARFPYEEALVRTNR